MACVVAMAAQIRKLGTMATVNDPYNVSVVLYMHSTTQMTSMA